MFIKYQSALVVNKDVVIHDDVVPETPDVIPLDDDVVPVVDEEVDDG